MSTSLPATGVANSVAPNQWSSAPNGALTLIGAGTQDNDWGGVNTNSTGNYDQGWKLNGVPADLANVLTCAVQLRFGWETTPGLSSWPNLDARVVANTKIIAASTSDGVFQEVANNITDTSPTNSSVISFDYVDTTATKADWDDAVLEIRIGRLRNMGGSTIEQRVFAAQITGTYAITPVDGSFRQQAFRFYGDNGNESGSTAIDSQNTNVFVEPYSAFRLRFGLEQTISNANQNLTKSFKIQYSLNDSTYADVVTQDSTTTPIRFSTSAFVSNNASTTSRLTGLNGSFVTGLIKNENASISITFLSGELSHTELEFIIEIYGGRFISTDNVKFRLVFSDGSTLDATTITPELRREKRRLLLQ